MNVTVYGREDTLQVEAPPAAVALKHPCCHLTLAWVFSIISQSHEHHSFAPATCDYIHVFHGIYSINKRGLTQG